LAVEVRLEQLQTVLLAQTLFLLPSLLMAAVSAHKQEATVVLVVQAVAVLRVVLVQQALFKVTMAQAQAARQAVVVAVLVVLVHQSTVAQDSHHL
jgi:hypothetical protein